MGHSGMDMGEGCNSFPSFFLQYEKCSKKVLIIYATLRAADEVRRPPAKKSHFLFGGMRENGYLCSMKSVQKKVLIIYATTRAADEVRRPLQKNQGNFFD